MFAPLKAAPPQGAAFLSVRLFHCPIGGAPDVAPPELLLYTEGTQLDFVYPIMVAPDPISVGVDTSSGPALTYAALDRDLKPVAIEQGDSGHLMAFLAERPSAFVAINAPSHLSTGIVRRRMLARQPASRNLRGADIRTAELDLRQRGLAISATPSSAVFCPPWVQQGLALYAELDANGFKPFPDDGADRQYLETHPHAAFAALLGCLPLPKPTLEGRLQRALVLFERGVRIRDPMSFLEEITRHRLLHGVLPMDLLHSPQHLDALVAAYTAWVAAHKPSETAAVGGGAEGSIVLPVSQLLDHY